MARNNNFKAVLRDAPGVMDQQILYATREYAEQWAKEQINRLTVAQKVTAYVRITEATEVWVADVHASKVAGEFAFAKRD